jgi:hypothetical protein
MLKLTTALLIWTLALTSCSLLGDGTNTFVKESSNKIRNKKAVLFLRQAGATVGDSYQVSIMDNSDEFDKSEVGNTFTVDTNHGETWLNSNSINFIWLRNDTLQIDYDKKLRTFIQERRVNGVSILYKAR